MAERGDLRRVQWVPGSRQGTQARRERDSGASGVPHLSCRLAVHSGRRGRGPQSVLSGKAGWRTRRLSLSFGEFAGVSKHVTWNVSLPSVFGTVAVGPALAPGHESGPVSRAAQGRPGAETEGAEGVAAWPRPRRTGQMGVGGAGSAPGPLPGRLSPGPAVCLGAPTPAPGLASLPSETPTSGVVLRRARSELQGRRGKSQPRTLTRALAKERSGASPARRGGLRSGGSGPCQEQIAL